MCGDSEAGSYFRLIDFVIHSTLGLRVREKKKRRLRVQEATAGCVFPSLAKKGVSGMDMTRNLVG